MVLYHSGVWRRMEISKYAISNIPSLSLKSFHLSTFLHAPYLILIPYRLSSKSRLDRLQGNSHTEYTKNQTKQ